MKAMLSVLAGLPPSQRWPVVIWPRSWAMRARAEAGSVSCEKEIAGDGKVVAAEDEALDVGLH